MISKLYYCSIILHYKILHNKNHIYAHEISHVIYFSDLLITVPLFTGEESHMVVNGGDLRYSIDIEVEFKPDSLSGILLYAAQRFSEQSGDFIALSLSDGRVHLRISFGGENFVVLTSDQQLSTGK